MLKTTIAVNLQNFLVPELISEGDSIDPPVPALAQAQAQARPTPRSFAYSEIATEDLSDMCDAFRKGVFEKANRSDPNYHTQKVTGAGPVAYPAAERASKLITLVIAGQSTKGLTAALSEAADQGLINDYNSEGDSIAVILTPSIKISFHK